MSPFAVWQSLAPEALNRHGQDGRATWCKPDLGHYLSLLYLIREIAP